MLFGFSLIRNLLPNLKFTRVNAAININMSKGKKHLSVGYENEASSSINTPKKNKFIPQNYEEILENIRTMRTSYVAPVDSMGCQKCYDDDADPVSKRFQILVALMLSAQTKDEITHAACQRLKTVGFTSQTLANIDVSVLEKLLVPVGFYKTKAKHIKKASQIILDEYNGDIPNTAETLMKLPGVGPKMAHICMNAAWNVVTGIGVDVHVHRIANRLEWVSKPTKDPEKTRAELESWVPFDLWSEINLMLVGFGQTVCLPKSPNCASCLNQKICPSAFKESPKKSTKAKK